MNSPTATARARGFGHLHAHLRGESACLRLRPGGKPLYNFDDIVTFKEAWQMQGPQTSLSAGSQCVYVTDSNNNRVQVFSTSGAFVSGIGAGYNGVGGSIGSSGPGNGKFTAPSGIALDASGNFWVTDPGNDLVQKFNGSGTWLRQFGAWGSANGQFHSDGGIAIDASGNIWVTDFGDDRVEKFNGSGTWLLSVGGPPPYTCETSPAGSAPACAAGAANGQFAGPANIAFDAAGNVYVTDISSDNTTNRVQKFDSNGNYLSQFGSAGFANGQFNTVAPGGIAFDVSGNILVADVNGDRIEKFNSSGSYLSQIGGCVSGACGASAANGQFSWVRARRLRCQRQYLGG